MFEQENKQPTLAEIKKSYFKNLSEETELDFELNIVEVKKAINNLLWTYLPKDTTIGEAEDLAIDILGEINDLHTKYNKENS